MSFCYCFYLCLIYSYRFIHLDKSCVSFNSFVENYFHYESFSAEFTVHFQYSFILERLLHTIIIIYIYICLSRQIMILKTGHFPTQHLSFTKLRCSNIWCLTKKLCMRCDAWVGVLLWWCCQSPVAHGCGLLNHPNSFCREMFKLNTKFDASSLPYSLSHFECDDHTVHMLTQWRLLPPLTSTVKSSLFMHVHSSLLSLSASLHWCCTNCPRCINNGWTFSGMTSSYTRC